MISYKYRFVKRFYEIIWGKRGINDIFRYGKILYETSLFSSARSCEQLLTKDIQKDFVESANFP